jgi:hypothetical protein
MKQLLSPGFRIGFGATIAVAALFAALLLFAVPEQCAWDTWLCLVPLWR